MKFTRQHVSMKRTRNAQNWECIRHEELDAKIKNYVRELKACPLNGTDYVTYAMQERVREVGKPDIEIPFYVGQTSDLANRALEHFRAGGRPVKDTSSVYWRMHQILSAYRVPVFEILDRKPTLASSLLSESTWVQRFIAEGYTVWNQWSEHQLGKFVGNVPSRRLWMFTLRQALMDDLCLAIGCRKCRYALDLPLDELAKVAPLNTRLCDIRSTFRCPQCNASPCLRLSAYTKAEPAP